MGHHYSKQLQKYRTEGAVWQEIIIFKIIAYALYLLEILLQVQYESSYLITVATDVVNNTITSNQDYLRLEFGN